MEIWMVLEYFRSSEIIPTQAKITPGTKLAFDLIFAQAKQIIKQL